MAMKERLLVAREIQAYLDAKGFSRKDLIRKNLSESTIHKVFRGVYSDRTLRKIEAILKVSFNSQSDTSEPETASRHHGGYTYHAVAGLEGKYLCARPLFDDPVTINAYLIEIKWNKSDKALGFEEGERKDRDYCHQGCVYIAWGSPFMNLVSIDSGNVRSLLVSLPDERGVCRGIVTTLHKHTRTMQVPVCAPVFLQQLKTDEELSVGLILPDSERHSSYQDILGSVMTEYCGHFVSPGDRRRRISIVGARASLVRTTNSSG
jgi:hypothetical protein